MRLSVHIALTVPVAAIFYGITKSWCGSMGVFITGVLVDVDHLLEYWHDRGIKLNIPEFFKYGNSGINTRHFIVFHSYELLVILLLCMQISTLSYFFFGLATGLLLHLILDYINIMVHFKYRWYSFIIFSLIFRALFSFRRDRIDKILRHIT